MEAAPDTDMSEPAAPGPAAAASSPPPPSANPHVPRPSPAVTVARPAAPSSTPPNPSPAHTHLRRTAPPPIPVNPSDTPRMPSPAVAAVINSQPQIPTTPQNIPQQAPVTAPLVPASATSAPALPANQPPPVPTPTVALHKLAGPSRTTVKPIGAPPVINRLPTATPPAVRPIPSRPAGLNTRISTSLSHSAAASRLPSRTIPQSCRPSGKFPLTNRTGGKRRLRQCCIDAQRQAAKIARLSSDARARSGAASQRMLTAATHRPTTARPAIAVPTHNVVNNQPHGVPGPTAPGTNHGKPETPLVKPITSVSAQGVKREAQPVAGSTARPASVHAASKEQINPVRLFSPVKPINLANSKLAVKREPQLAAAKTSGPTNVHAASKELVPASTNDSVQLSLRVKPLNPASAKVAVKTEPQAVAAQTSVLATSKAQVSVAAVHNGNREAVVVKPTKSASASVVVKMEPQPVAAKTSGLANAPVRSNKQVTAASVQSATTPITSAPSAAIGTRNVSSEARKSTTSANVSMLPRGSARPAAAACACAACAQRRAQRFQGHSGKRSTALPKPYTPSLSTGTNAAPTAGPPGTRKAPVVPPGALAAAARAAAAVEPTPPLQPRTSSETSTAQAPTSTPIRRTAPALTAAIKLKPVVTKLGAPVSRAIPGHVSSATQVPVSTATPASVLSAVPECVSPVTASQTPLGTTPLAPSADTAPPRTFADDAHVTMWNREEQRKIAGNAAPLGRNVDRYLQRHPECEIYVSQDHGRVTRRCDRSDRKKQRVNPAELGAGVHVSIWNRKESRKVAGNAAPLNKNLHAYLAKHPHCEVYNGQDDVSTINEENEINQVEQDAEPESDSNPGPASKLAAPTGSAVKPVPPAEAEGGLDAWKKLSPSDDTLDPLFKTDFDLADEWVQGSRSGEDRVSPMVVETSVGNDLSTMILDIQDVVPLDEEVDVGADGGDPFEFFTANELPPLEF